MKTTMSFQVRSVVYGLRFDLISWGIVATAWFLMNMARGADDLGSPTAAGLMERAHHKRAMWSDFPGFRADLRVSSDGAVTTGTLQVDANGSVELSLDNGESFRWVKGSLRSLVSHRLSAGDAIRDVAFADEDLTHPLGRLLQSTASGDQSRWRIKGDVMTEVHRQHGDTRFIISETDVYWNAEGRHLPRSFDVVTWDTASSRIKSSRQVFHEWTRVGSFDLPMRVTAAVSKDDGSRRVEQIEFSNVQLLPRLEPAAPRE